MLHFSEIDHIEAYYKDEIPYYDALETYSEQLIFKNKHYEYFSFLFYFNIQSVSNTKTCNFLYFTYGIITAVYINVKSVRFHFI